MLDGSAEHSADGAGDERALSDPPLRYVQSDRADEFGGLAGDAAALFGEGGMREDGCDGCRALRTTKLAIRAT